MIDLHFLHSQLTEDGENSQSVNDFDHFEIFIVEDDLIFGKTLKKILEKEITEKVHHFIGPAEFLEFINQRNGTTLDLKDHKNKFCLVTDISFENGGTDGLLLIDHLHDRHFNFFSIAMTGFATIENAIQATKKGVFHYLTKPFETSSLVKLIWEGVKKKFHISANKVQMSRALKCDQTALTPVHHDRLKLEAPSACDMFCGIIGRSQKMKRIFEKIEKVAKSDSTILITGPSGTGKELISKAIHQLSERHHHKMISVNCGAIPADLLESELFGHERGAFTGAVATRKGRFELADKGTMFLDEIGDMPLLLQVKLLRVLQNREIEPVGSNILKQIDVRIITATHRDLDQMVSAGDFREDLFYRLNVIPIRIPALKERRDDIPLLISYFLGRFVSADGRNKLEFSDEALELMFSYDWPGNVRELENLIERLVILKGGTTVTEKDLPAKFLETRPDRVSGRTEDSNDNYLKLPIDGLDLKQTLEDIEKDLIKQALETTRGNKNQASKLLKMNRTTLIEKLKKKGMNEFLGRED